jgi:hypothetical protein
MSRRSGWHTVAAHRRRLWSRTRKCCQVRLTGNREASDETKVLKVVERMSETKTQPRPAGGWSGLATMKVALERFDETDEESHS